jgi:drug/metabolite transporter (DMT)-like permease
MLNHFILVLSILMLSTAPVIVKFIELRPIVILSWRLLFVSLMLVPFAYRKLKELPLADIKGILVTSLIFYIHFYTWFSGVPKLDVGVTATIFALNPIFTAVFGFLVLKEEFKYRYLISIIASILGIHFTYYSTSSGSQNLLGVIQILVASMTYSLYLIYSKKYRGELSNSVFTLLLNFGTCLLGAVTIIIYLGTDQISLGETIPKGGEVWTYLFLLALLPSLLGHTLMIYSLPFYNLNFISCLKLFGPINASILAYFLLDEQFNEKVFLGLGLVTAGVLFALPWGKGKLILEKGKIISRIQKKIKQ